MPSTTRTQKAATNLDVKHVAPNQMVLSKKAGGNISEYPAEFTKDSK